MITDDYLMMPPAPSLSLAVRNLDGRTPQVIEPLDGDPIEHADSATIADVLSEVMPQVRRLVRERILARYSAARREREEG